MYECSKKDKLIVVEVQDIVVASQNSGVTHTDSNGKRSMNFTWTPPATGLTSVYFMYAITLLFVSSKRNLTSRPINAPFVREVG